MRDNCVHFQVKKSTASNELTSKRIATECQCLCDDRQIMTLITTEHDNNTASYDYIFKLITLTVLLTVNWISRSININLGDTICLEVLQRNLKHYQYKYYQ